MPDTKSGSNRALNLRAMWQSSIGRQPAVAAAGPAIAARRTGIPVVEKQAGFNITNN
jgi:hypothetical protein